MSQTSKLKTDSDSALFLKQLGLYSLAKENQHEHAPDVGFLLESPEDPAGYAGEKQAPSFWAWPEWEYVTRLDPSIRRISFDQKCFGHTQVKPTTVATNLQGFGELDGCRAATRGEPLASDLVERFQQTSSWSCWAPGLKKVVRVALSSLCRAHANMNPELKKALNNEEWKTHIRQGHQPYRRDCRACILGMAAGAPHRRRKFAGSSAWSMGVDVVPMIKTATGQVVKNVMIATALVPVFDDEYPKSPKDESNGPHDDENPSVGPGESWGDGLEEDEYALWPEENAEEPPSAGAPKVCEERPSGESSLSVEEGKVHGEKERVDPLKAHVDELSQPLRVRHVTLATTLTSRRAGEVQHGLNLLYTKFKYMGIEVQRIHSDRAKEFLSAPVRAWCARTGVVQSMSPGDDPQANGHVESEVGQVKRRTRLYLHEAGLDPKSWPGALRYAVEERCRKQLALLGVPALPMLPFNASVAVKRKRWHDRGHLAPPFVEGHLVCPSPLMHNGWVVLTKDLQAVHVREALVPAPLGDEAALALHEHAMPPIPVEEEERPPWRLVGKQPRPGPEAREGSKIPLPHGRYDSHGLLEDEPQDDYEPSIAPTDINGALDDGVDPSGLLDDGVELSGLLEDGVDPSGPLEGGDDPSGALDAGNDPAGREIGGSDAGNVDGPAEAAGGEPPRVFKAAERKSRAVCEKFIVQRVSCRRLEQVFVEQHASIQAKIQDLLGEVPMTGEHGREVGTSVQWLVSERDGLERDLKVLDEWDHREIMKLWSLNAGGEQVHLGEDGEVLQTTTISLEDVRRDIASWVPAMKSEYGSLVHETKAIIPVDEKDLDPSKVEFVPGKLVCTIKAGPNGGKRKCRSVVCGNLLNESQDPSPQGSYASGADGTLIRTAIRYGVQKNWGMSTTDIRTAFLLAPRPPPVEGSREVIVLPPRILVAAEVCQPSERWRVDKALYGFQSSPNLWAGHRDKTLRTFQWHDQVTNELLGLVQTAEGNLWRIGVVGSDGTVQGCKGHLIVYVDDLMVIGPETVRQDFLGRVEQEWKISMPEHVNAESWVRFCGFELKWQADGRLAIAQPSYTKELLERHQVTKTRSSPMPKIEPPDTTEDLSKESIRRAQALTGELLWLSIRTRPDIAFSVGQMGRQATRNPTWACELGYHVLEFLAGSPNVGLVYGSCLGDHGAEEQLGIPRHETLIEAFSDVSFAPQGGRSLQGVLACVAGAPVQWESNRQPFPTLSTAESELMGYCEAMTMLQSIEALMVAIVGVDDGSGFEKVILGDNQSAIQIVQKPDGPWRTRHLRLRATCLKHKLSSVEGSWKLRYVKGTELVADLLTKPITQVSTWRKFWDFLGMNGPCPPTEDPSTEVRSLALAKVTAMEKTTAACALLALAVEMKLTHADDDAWAPTTTAVLAAAVMAFFYWLRELIRCFELVIADPCIGCGSLGSEEGRGLRDVFIPQVRSPVSSFAESVQWLKDYVQWKDARAARRAATNESSTVHQVTTLDLPENSGGLGEEQSRNKQERQEARGNEPAHKIKRLEEKMTSSNLGPKAEGRFREGSGSNRVGCGSAGCGLACCGSAGLIPADLVLENAWHGQAKSSQEQKKGEGATPRWEIEISRDLSPTGSQGSQYYPRVKAMAMSKAKAAASSAAGTGSAGSGYGVGGFGGVNINVNVHTTTEDAAGSMGTVGAVGKPSVGAGTDPSDGINLPTASGVIGPGPWHMAAFSQPPTVTKDKWSEVSMEGLNGGKFLVRTHGAAQYQGFHPLHKGCPSGGNKLEPARVQIRFPVHQEERSEPIVIVNDWRDAPTREREYQWRGYTFFKLKNEERTLPSDLPPEFPSSTYVAAGDGVTYTGGDGARGPRAGPVIEPPMPAGGSRASRPLTREDCWEHIYDGPVEEV